MKPHPDRHLLFLEHVQREQQAAEEIAEQVAPVVPDVLELAVERVRRGQGRRPEHVDQVLVRGPEARAGLEVLAQRPADRVVRGALGQRTLVEQLVERPERGVEIGEPDSDELFQGHGPMRDPAGLAGQPLGGRLQATVHRHRGEPIGERRQGRVEGDPRDARLEPGEGIQHGPRIALDAVQGQDDVRDLVEDPHGVERARVHGAIGMPARLANRVHPVRERATGGHVDDDHVAGQREDGVGERVTVPRLACDVELEPRARDHDGSIVAPPTVSIHRPTGPRSLNLRAVPAPNAAAAAQYYPAISWYSMLKIPEADQFGGKRACRIPWGSTPRARALNRCRRRTASAAIYREGRFSARRKSSTSASQIWGWSTRRWPSAPNAGNRRNVATPPAWVNASW